MDGWALCEALRADASLSPMPVLVVSDDADLGRHAAALRASGCLRKPIDIDKLIEAIHHHCTRDA